MLVKGMCINFRSFGSEPMKLDLVASPKIRKHSMHVRALSGAKVLRNAAIYGANAAGKSNVVLSLSFMKASVTSGALPPNTAHEYCRVGDGLAHEESTFEVQFIAGGRAFDYGFTCLLGDHRVTGEWLYALEPEPIALFTRSSDGAPTYDSLLQDKIFGDDGVRFSIYADDFALQTSKNPALLFLTSVGQGKRFSDGSAFEAFGTALNWFARDLRIMGAGQPAPTSEFYTKESTLNEVAQVLASFDTGVEHLRKQPIEMDELERYINPALAMNIRQLLAQNQQAAHDARFVLTVRDGGSFVGIERTGGHDPVATVLEIRHRGSKFDFAFGDESDGTRRLFDFMDILFSQNREAVFVIDEIDRSLHPMLTQHLVKLFNEVHGDDDCQLIFTTHENAIMSYDYFRKDEIWLVDRDDVGRSHLYALDDFEDLRSDAVLSKQYLEGRYGGIPALSMGAALAALLNGDD